MKKYTTLFLLLTLKFAYSQVVISEIHRDSMFNEDMYSYMMVNQQHHLGEYIELYNYTTEDIPLGGWRLTDNVSGYIFPSTAIIPSGGYVIVAYGTAGNTSYFTDFYPTAQGHQAYLFFQSNILIGNTKDNIRLIAETIKGKHYGKEISYYSWTDLGLGDWDGNFVYNPSTNYYNTSFEYQFDTKTYMNNVATPFSSNYTLPQPIELSTIPYVQNLYYDNYADLTWDEIVQQVFSIVCSLTISDVDQQDGNTYLGVGRCFTYDTNGNNLSSSSCIPPATVTPPTNNTSYSESEIENFDSSIIISPNPTGTTTTASWSGNVTGKITTIIVANTNGIILNTFVINPLQTSQIIDLTPQPSSIYIVNFTLDTNQFISRNIIKY